MRIGLGALSNFFRQFSTLSASGIPMIQSLTTLERTSSSRVLRRAIVRVRTDIQAGAHLAEAFENQGNAFPVIARRMVDVGERTGSLDRAFAGLARYYEWRRRMGRRVIAGSILPAIQLILAVHVIALALFLINYFAEGAPSQQAWPIARNFLLKCYLTVLGIFVFYFVMTRIVAGKKFFDYILLSIPVFGGIAKRVYVARLTFAMELMVKAALALPEMLVKAGEATGNAVFAKRFSRAAREISEGRTLAEALSRTNLLDRTFLEIVQVAEESGQMDESLARLANQRSEDAERAISYLATALAWLVYIVVAAFIIYFIFKFFMMYVRAFTGLMDSTGI